MKLFLLNLCFFGYLGAQPLTPAIPGQRIAVEVSSDLQTWTMALPYNSPRGFIRARTETNAQFAAWITAADALTGTDVEIFKNGQRNPQCWGASIDLTPFCITEKAGVLVSPCHVLFVTHWHPNVGDTVQWMTADNQVISRTLTALVSLPDTSYLEPDITVGRINEDVPAGVSFVRVLKDSAAMRDWDGYLVPAVMRDQSNALHEADVLRIWPSPPTAWLQAPLSPARLPRYKEMVSGDSGSPVCVVDEGGLVLLLMISQGGTIGRGAFLPAYIEPINAAMTTLGGGYQLSTTP